MLKHCNTDGLKRWIGAINLEPVRCAELTEDQIWSEAQPHEHIWQTRRFLGTPAFYPVYQWREYYSYSPLSLLLKKGRFNLDPEIVQLLVAKELIYLSTSGTLDREIKRLGGPMRVRPILSTPELFARAIADALRKDISHIEAAHKGTTNVILCGGMDSLNLLFLSWKNPVVIVSAEPNYPLVKQFIAEHSLPFEVRELEDSDQMLPQEILANFCRNNLEHCRWGPALAEIARNYDGELIFWKGQLGGTLMTPRWADFTNPAGNDWAYLKTICSISRGRGEYRIRACLRKYGAAQWRTVDNLWKRGAMWQGAHMSLIRQLTGALTLSAYHGPAMRRVLEQVDFNKAVPYDIRPLIGEYLYGKPVSCPRINPGPPLSKIRSGVSGPQSFLEVLQSAGIPGANSEK